MKCCRLIALSLPLLLPLAVAAAQLTVLVDTGTEMPMARFERGELVGGIHRDVGLALGKATGREVHFLALPRKRLVKALATGEADVLCGYVPEWLDGRFAWSQPFFPIVEVLITDARAPAPARIADVAGETIGTVLGYHHPELVHILGPGFVREDAATTEATLRKLAAGRMHHAVTSQLLLDYRLKLGDPPLSLHTPLVVKRYQTRCAVSPHGQIKVAEVDKAVAQLLRDGGVNAILARYK